MSASPATGGDGSWLSSASTKLSCAVASKLGSSRRTRSGGSRPSGSGWGRASVKKERAPPLNETKRNETNQNKADRQAMQKQVDECVSVRAASCTRRGGRAKECNKSLHEARENCARCYNRLADRSPHPSTDWLLFSSIDWVFLFSSVD